MLLKRRDELEYFPLEETTHIRNNFFPRSFTTICHKQTRNWFLSALNRDWRHRRSDRARRGGRWCCRGKDVDETRNSSAALWETAAVCFQAALNCAACFSNASGDPSTKTALAGIFIRHLGRGILQFHSVYFPRDPSLSCSLKSGLSSTECEANQLVARVKV